MLVYESEVAEVREHHRKRREENRKAWAAHHRAQARSIAKTAASLCSEHLEKARELEGLGG